MKFKKIIPLILVLMLVFTLTACDNWQRGIDEVQDADGPSWDLDLSVPLLPETNVPVGEELYSFLEDEGFIDDDLDDVDDIRIRERAEIIEEIKLSDQVDIDDFNFDDLVDGPIVEMDNLPDSELDGDDINIDPIEIEIPDYELEFDFGDVDVDSIDLGFEIDQSEFEVSETITISSDEFTNNQVNALDIDDHDVTETIALELPDLPDQVDYITFDSGDINITVESDDDIDYEYVIKGIGDETSDGDGYFKNREVSGGEIIEVKFGISLEDEGNPPTEDIEVTAKTAGVEIGTVYLSDNAVEDTITTQIEDLDFESMGEDDFIEFTKGKIELKFVPDDIEFEELNIKVADQELDEDDGVYSFEGIEISEDDIDNDGNLVIEIYYDAESWEYSDSSSIDVSIKETEDLDWEVHIENYQVEDLDDLIDFSDQFDDLDNIDPSKINFSDGIISFEITGNGLESYRIEINIDEIEDDIESNDDYIDLEDESLSVTPEIAAVFTGVISQEAEKIEIDISLDDAEVESIDLEDPFDIAGEIEDDIIVSLDGLPDGVESITLSEGKINITGLTDLLEPEDNEGNRINQIDIEMILPDGETKIEADMIIDEDTEEVIYQLDLAGALLEREGDEWSDIEIKVSSDIYELKAVDEIAVNADVEEDIDWEEVTIKGNFLDDELEDFSNISEELDLSDTGLDELDDILEFFALTGETINFLLDLDTNIEEGLNLFIDNIIIKGFDDSGEAIKDEDGNILKIEKNDIQFESGDRPQEILDLDDREKLAELIMEQPEKIKFEIGDISAADPDDTFTITKESKISADAIFELALTFELRDTDGEGEFVFEGDPVELDIDAETRETLSNNLVEVKLVQEIVNQLPLTGEIEIVIGEELEPDNGNFYDEDNLIYESGLLDLRDDTEKYRFETELGEEFISSLKNDNLYVGFKVKIPLLDEDGNQRKISFSRSDMIELKVWTNVTVTVNPGN